MQKNKNRQGLALGAVFAMVASLFVMASPAQANESSAVIYPSEGLETQTTILGDEAFDLDIRFGTSVDAGTKEYINTPAAGFGVVFTKPAGVTLSATVTGEASASATVSGTVAGTTYTAGAQSSQSGTAAVKMAVALPGRTSVSAAVAIIATPFLDLNRNGAKDAGEPSGTAVTINFVPWSTLGATVSITEAVAGDDELIGTFAVTPNAAINWAQLAGSFFISVSHTAETHASAAGGTDSAAVTGVALSLATFASASNTATGNYSASFVVQTAVFTTSGTVPSVSATVHYQAQTLVATAKIAVTGLGVSAVTISAVTGPNAVQTTGTAIAARVNSAFSLNAYPWSSSLTTSVAVASKVTVTSQTGIEFDADSGVILNGVTYTSSATYLAAEFTLAAGTVTIPMSSFGQNPGGNEITKLTIVSQLKTAFVDINLVAAAQTVAYAPETIAGTAGTAKSFAVTAKDQWAQSSVRSDQRIAASVVLGGSVSETVSAAVVNGAATVVVTPNPATRTGSAVVTFTLQSFDQASQAWKDTGTADTAVWNIFTYTAGTDSITSRTVSKSASISYGVALSWSETIAVVIANSFSDVVASAPGLMIQNADSTTVTASDVLTIAANGKTANFKFTSRLAGTYTVTFTNGTATTTSTIIVDVAGHDSGATLTFDKASIANGTTTTVTGTLKDVNGNPVMTSGSSDVSVAWTGKGLPFGNATNMETDASGQLTFYVLVLSGEVGDAAISATYKPAGLAVSTKNVSVVHAVAVGKAAASAAADQKVNVGSFKGYVALYAKGYEGQKMSAIVAGKWIVVASLASDFERVVRFTGAGYTITTKIYIDGVQIGDEFTTVTK
jgi:hypothetical protein